MRKLYIKQFGPVKEAELELREVNLFIGEQSVGKSTIAKLITILTDHISLMRLIGGSSVSWLYSWETELKAHNLDAYKEDDYEIVYDMEEHGIHFHLEVRPDKLSSYMIKNNTRITDKDKIILELIAMRPIRNNAFQENMQKAESHERNNLAHSLEFISNSLYIPAERIIHSVITNLMPALTLTQSAIPQNLLRFMVNMRNAKATYPRQDFPLLNIIYTQKDAEDYIVIKENQKELPLSYASSGIQSTIPLLLVLQFAIEHRDYSSFVIEEPECNLFPEKQVELLKYLLQIVKSNKRTLTITTHSPYLLSAMNNYLFAGTLVDEYKDEIKEEITKVLPEAYQLRPGECSVYSLGEDINGDGIYCKTLIDEETGMIDYNSLDTISAMMSEEFSAIEDAYIQMTERKG